MKKSPQFYVCPKGCFSMDPLFQCTHKGGKSQGSGDDLILVLDDEPDAGRSPGEKIAASRELARANFERRGQATAYRRAVIEKILHALRKELVKTNRWTGLMYMGDQFPQLPPTFHYWPSKLAFVVRDLVWKLDEASWS